MRTTYIILMHICMQRLFPRCVSRMNHLGHETSRAPTCILSTSSRSNLLDYIGIWHGHSMCSASSPHATLWITIAISSCIAPGITAKSSIRRFVFEFVAPHKILLVHLHLVISLANKQYAHVRCESYKHLTLRPNCTIVF